LGKDNSIDAAYLLKEHSREGRMFKDSHKAVDEWGVARQLIEALGLSQGDLFQNDKDPPDAIFQYEGKTIGIENTFCGVTHGKLDSLNKKIIRSAKNFEAAKGSLNHRHMSKFADENHNSVEAYKQALVWGRETFLSELRTRIAQKEANKSSECVDENWLHIWSCGANISLQDATAFLDMQPFNSNQFTRIYLTLEKVAGSKILPVFKLK
jgi:hypothetical protein